MERGLIEKILRISPPPNSSSPDRMMEGVRKVEILTMLSLKKEMMMKGFLVMGREAMHRGSLLSQRASRGVLGGKMGTKAGKS